MKVDIFPPHAKFCRSIGLRKSQEKVLIIAKSMKSAFSQNTDTRENGFIFQSMRNVSGLVCLFEIGVMILTSRFPSLSCVMSPLALLMRDFKIQCQYYIQSWSILRKTQLVPLKCLSAEWNIHNEFCMTFHSLHITAVCPMVESTDLHKISVNPRGRAVHLRYWPLVLSSGVVSFLYSLPSR